MTASGVLSEFNKRRFADQVVVVDGEDGGVVCDADDEDDSSFIPDNRQGNVSVVPSNVALFTMVRAAAASLSRVVSLSGPWYSKYLGNS